MRQLKITATRKPEEREDPVRELLQIQQESGYHPKGYYETYHEQLDFQRRTDEYEEPIFKENEPVNIRASPKKTTKKGKPKKSVQSGKHQPWMKKTYASTKSQPPQEEPRDSGPSQLHKKEFTLDTKTTGLFDDKIRKDALQQYVLKQNRIMSRLAKETHTQSTAGPKKTTAKIVKSEHMSQQPHPETGFNDYEQFANYITDERADKTQTMALSKIAESEIPMNEVVRNKKEKQLDDELNKIYQEYIGIDEKKNPFTTRKIREMLDNKQKKKKSFFVSRHVDRDKLYDSDYEGKSATIYRKHAKTTSIEPEDRPVTGEGRRKSLVYKSNENVGPYKAITPLIDPTTHQDISMKLDKRSKSPPKGTSQDLDLYPTHEDGRTEKKAKRERLKQTAPVEMRAIQQHPATTQGMPSPKTAAITKELQSHYRSEIDRQIKIQKSAKTLQKHMEKRMQDPEQQLTQLEKKIARVQQSLAPIMENFEYTAKALKKSLKLPSRDIYAKGTARIIRSCADRLTEKILDDFLYEIIPILQLKEEQEKKERAQRVTQNVLYECFEAIKELAFEQNTIKQKSEELDKLALESMTKMREIDITKEVLARREEREYKQYQLPIARVSSILEGRERYNEFKQSVPYLQKENAIIYQMLAENILEEELVIMAHHFDSAQDEFVEVLFKEEFK